MPEDNHQSLKKRISEEAALVGMAVFPDSAWSPEARANVARSCAQKLRQLADECDSAADTILNTGTDVLSCCES